MTKQEFRNSQEYANLMQRIRSYKPGFRFTINYAAVRADSEGKYAGLHTLLEDAIKEGYLESVAIGWSLDGLLEGKYTEETFLRTNKQ